jgi:restriction system protein
MAKDKFSRTKACATKTLYAVMKEMSRRGGSMPAKELYPYVNENVELTDWEKEPAGKMKYIRWTNSFQFYSIRLSEGWFHSEEEWQLVLDTRRRGCAEKDTRGSDDYCQ